MHINFTSRLFSFALGTAALVTLGACGGSSSPSTQPAGDGGTSSSSTGGGTSDSDAGAGGSTGTQATSKVSDAPGTCTNPTIPLAFSPMYSAFIPGDTTHTFQVPAVTDDGSAATWSISDPTQAQLVAQNFNGLPGVMITLQGAATSTNGQLTVVATAADGSCGSAVLHITSTTENDWMIGDARYNDGVSLMLGGPPGGGDGGVPPGGGFRPDGGGPGGFRPTGGGSFFERDGGTACTNCHGPTATSGPYKDVSHTPEQTAGFSDDQLIQIITKGEVPDGGYFDPTVLVAGCDGGAQCTQRAQMQWHAFHQWADITAAQYPGMVAYLRSLQPETQTGASNFGGGGRRRGDGGMPMRRNDAGVAAASDAAVVAASDAAVVAPSDAGP